ncbi:hypothetical protein M9Y10_000509 [Tritrichomonas musculus]|uniref:Protein kinase domain-containing protein n=1 Tax=Tritrichomonas musculus TaxID=1915356 RepID=A0ABR2L5F7_9EUKA
MFEDILSIQKLLAKDTLTFPNKHFTKIIKEYNFHQISEKFDLYNNQEIYNNLEKSSLIIIDFYSDANSYGGSQYFFVSFKKTILFIQKNNLSSLQSLFSYNKNIPICFLSNSKSIFSQEVQIQNEELEYHLYFDQELQNFNQELCFRGKGSDYLMKTWRTIRSCICGYLIKQSYLKLNTKRSENFSIDNKTYFNSTIHNDDYIILRQIDNGSIFAVYLIYHIEREELYALKKPNIYDDEIAKLTKREYENYSKIAHPYLPKFYGRVEKLDYLVIEFIYGQSLHNYHNNLDYNDRLTIIFMLMTSLHFLHKNNLIYRDLKPGNIMINANKEAILVDFDRMISFGSTQKEIQNFTNCFTSFSAPEVNKGNFSYECDVYSLGKIILYLLKKEIEFEQDSRIQQICKKCTKEEPNERPSISKLIFEFYLFYHSKIRIKNYFDLFEEHFINDYDTVMINNLKKLNQTQDISEIDFITGCVYYEGKYIQQDVNKAIYYLSQAAKKNHSEANYILGNIYYSNELVERDIDKAIHNYSQAAIMNNSKAQYWLGYIYYKCQYVKLDINKFMKYFTLSAGQNNLEAQMMLFHLYFKGIYVKRDMQKAIHYLTLSANQNFLDSLYKLGVIYGTGKLIEKDIKKAIYYYNLAAKQNHQESLYNLGIIYYNGEDVQIDVDRAIYYFTQSSDQNHLPSQEALGLIYSNELNRKYDFDKAFYYYSLAAKQNSKEAQYFLGTIYMLGKDVPRDDEKAIYYLTLAADQQVTNAEINLYILYISETSPFYDANKAMHYLKQSAYKNNSYAQYEISKYYLKGEFVEKNVSKSIFFLTQAAKNREIEAIFALGFLYHEGKYVKRDINKAIHYYKDASSLNHLKAKNNLGVIYQYGFGDEIEKNIGKAIEYYNEIIKKSKDKVAIYNMACLMLYEEPYKNSINKSIELFKESYMLGFNSLYMLSIALIKKNGYDINEFKDDFNQNEIDLYNEVCESLDFFNINSPICFDFIFDLQNKDLYLYDHLDGYQRNFIPDAEQLRDEALERVYNKNKINSVFFEGFGISLDD